MIDFNVAVLNKIDKINIVNSTLIEDILNCLLARDDDRYDRYYQQLKKGITIQFQLTSLIRYYEEENKAQVARLIDWCQDQLSIFNIDITDLLDILRKDTRYGRYYSKRLR